MVVGGAWLHKSTAVAMGGCNLLNGRLNLQNSSAKFKIEIDAQGAVCWYLLVSLLVFIRFGHPACK